MTKGYRQSQTRNIPTNTSSSTPGVDETIIDLVDVKSKAESFYESNKMAILGIGGGLLLLIGGFLAYKFLYQAPKNKEAMEQMYQAEILFEKDSFEMALNNPGGGFPGFKEIAENYGGTSSGNLAKYYAAICNLKMGNYEEAKNFLSDYSASGPVMTILKNGVLGDVYAELNDFESAKNYYDKAGNSDNDFLTPVYLKKLGILQEKLGNKDAALKAYKKIKEKYPESPDGNNIEKNIISLQ